MCTNSIITLNSIFNLSLRQKNGRINMAVKIGFYNRKGGIGKTHSCINIGACLAMKGYKVLLLDADSQCNLSMFFFGEDDNMFSYDQGGAVIRDDVLTLYHVLEQKENIYNAIYKSKHYSIRRKLQSKFHKYEFDIDVMLCSRDMDTVEVDNPEYLREPLSRIEDEYDFILIDFPPSFTNLVTVYMIACDYILVPAKLGETTSIAGYFEVLKTVSGIKNSMLNENLDVLGLFYTMAMDYKQNQRAQYSESLENEASFSLFKTYIHTDYAANVLSNNVGDPFVICAPQSPCTKDYLKLTNEILERLGVN